MESLSSVSPSSSIVLPPNSHLLRLQQQQQRHRRIVVSSSTIPTKLSAFFNLRFSPEISRWKTCGVSGSGGGGGGGGASSSEEENREGNEKEEEEDVETALHLDGSIPGSSDQFVKQVSSRAYDMRRHLQQTFDSSSYDVLEANPWRGDSKPVYVLTQRENQLCTMKTRLNRSEVERELGALFSKGGKRKSETGNKTKQSRNGTNFRMLVEDVREGVLVFEDENDAAKYCDLLQGGGQGCEGVAEVEASSVFDICQKMRALAVLFRRGRTPPLPENLQLNLKAKKRSLEDQEDLI